MEVHSFPDKFISQHLLDPRKNNLEEIFAITWYWSLNFCPIFLITRRALFRTNSIQSRFSQWWTRLIFMEFWPSIPCFPTFPRHSFYCSSYTRCLLTFVKGSKCSLFHKEFMKNFHGNQWCPSLCNCRLFVLKKCTLGHFKNRQWMFRLISRYSWNWSLEWFFCGTPGCWDIIRSESELTFIVMVAKFQKESGVHFLPPWILS